MSRQPITAGMDIGDRYSHLCLLDTESGEVIKESKVRTSPEAFERYFSTAFTIIIEPLHGSRSA
jgi:hypothetical protein